MTVGDVVDKSNAEEEMDGTGGLRKVADLGVHGLSIGNGRFCTNNNNNNNNNNISQCIVQIMH